MNEICLSCRKHTKCGRAEHETIGCGYYVPMTNEEYLRSCNTEQLAEWLVDVTQYCFECGLNTNNCVLCPFGKCIDKGYAMEWLKQPHTPKE